jgi:hypothetical protein
MKAVSIERLVRRGAASLAESRHLYWPTNGRNDIAEHNIAIHVGRAFLEAGFAAFGEAHADGRTDFRLDALFLEPTHGIAVMTEFKRLYNDAQAVKMVADVDRILNFKMRSDLHPGVKIERSFGLVAATTWQPEYIAWFGNDGNNVRDPGSGLKELWESLRHRRATWGVSVLAHGSSGPSAEPWTHALVYALFPIAT